MTGNKSVNPCEVGAYELIYKDPKVISLNFKLLYKDSYSISFV